MKLPREIPPWRVILPYWGKAPFAKQRLVSQVAYIWNFRSR